MLEENVILVNEKDQKLGTMPKIEAHEKGVLHRAFSVFIINNKQELLLQQRAFSKYHSPGLWTNTCCSHQREGETSIDAGRRRLKEEMGIDVSIKYLFSFIYKTEFDNGLTEHELDHVMVGSFEKSPEINALEVSSWKWESLDFLEVDLKFNPEKYTIWFKIIFERFYENIKK
jgi:isopentenyl-diphosphate delta-isomerase